MIVTINVFGPPFLDGIRSNKDWTLIVIMNGDLSKGKTNLFKERFIHFTCQHVLDKAIYLASVDERVTVFFADEIANRWCCLLRVQSSLWLINAWLGQQPNWNLCRPWGFQHYCHLCRQDGHSPTPSMRYFPSCRYAGHRAAILQVLWPLLQEGHILTQNSWVFFKWHHSWTMCFKDT